MLHKNPPRITVECEKPEAAQVILDYLRGYIEGHPSLGQVVILAEPEPSRFRALVRRMSPGCHYGIVVQKQAADRLGLAEGDVVLVEIRRLG